MDLKEQMLLMNKYNITADELLFIIIILLIQNGESYDYLNDYYSIKCRKGIRDHLIELQNKQIITKEYKIPNSGEKFIPENISFNKNFVKNFHKCSFTIGKELFESYPMFCLINGNPTSIRSVSKKFDSLEDFYRFYGKSIGWNPNKHQEILDLIKWGSDNNVINCTLANFIIDKKWEVLQAMKNGEMGNINFDAVKLI